MFSSLTILLSRNYSLCLQCNLKIVVSFITVIFYSLLSHEDRLRESWDYLGQRREGSGKNLIKAYKYLKGQCKEDRARVFPVVPSDTTRGDRSRMKHKRPPELKETFFNTMRVT